MSRNPGIKGGQGFLQQHKTADPGLLCRTDGQFSCNLIERSRNSDDDKLVFQRIFHTASSHAVIPGLPHMEQITRAGFHRGDFLFDGSLPPGEDWRGAVHTPVSQPGLGRRNEAPRHESTLFTCKFPHHIFSLGIPGKCRALRRKVIGAGDVEKGRENRPPVDFPCGHQLRYFHEPDRTIFRG